MSGDSLISQIGVILGTILGIVVILYLAYISTKLIGKRYTFKSGGGKKLRIIENISVGKDSSLMIVKAGERVFLVGASSGGMSLISELESSEYAEEEQLVRTNMDFKTAFKTVLERNFGKVNKNDKENGNDSNQKK